MIDSIRRHPYGFCALGLFLVVLLMSSVSVVTNALRLRRFQRPKSAQAILNPPLRARVADWGYLVAIGVIAIGIGAGALWLGDKAGMGVTDDGDGHQLQIVEMSDSEDAEAPMDMPGD